MKRDVNQFLLGLVLLACFGIVTLVLYYNVTFESLNEKYRESLGELENKSSLLNVTLFEAQEKKSQVEKQQEVLNQYLSELNLSQKRESSLGEHIGDIQTDKLKVERALNNTILERDDWIKSYNKARDEADVCQADLRVKGNQLTDLKDDANALEIRVVNTGYRVDDAKDYNTDIYAAIDALDDFVRSNTNYSASDLSSWITTVKTSSTGMSDKLRAIEDDVDDIEVGLRDIKE